MSTHDGYSTHIARYLTVYYVAEELSTLIESTSNPSYANTIGIGIQWGTGAIGTITFPISFSSECYVVNAGIQNGNSYAVVNNVTKTGCDIWAYHATDNICYIAIGK